SRGERTVEVMKQDLHNPYPVEKQVAIIFALTQGFLDDIPVEDIKRFEKDFLAYLEQNNSEILASIRETKQLPDTEAFKSAIEAFKKTFAVSNQ
ncbi:MAG TPA: F0F1 ATP synthase subunit alpha, partial [Candidatus Angelobacter sp.]|nr:F0F1 ATP synthase subunit alpha [Candidatus Angelobacter sp.]